MPYPTQKLMFINILHGGQDNRTARILQFVKDESVEFLGLAELNTWNKQELQRFGEQIGMPHTYFLYTKHGYHLGVCSRHAFELVSKKTDELWHHGHIYVNVKALDISILVTHLSPHSSIVRRWEASQILATWQRQLPLLVLGDLNTLSPLYASEHTKLELPGLFASRSPLRKKFLNDDGTIDYLPMKMLLSELHDCGIGTSTPTVPTSLTEDSMHAAPMHLDYALSSIKGGFIATTAVNEDTSTLSDHYPLVVQRCEKEQQHRAWKKNEL